MYALATVAFFFATLHREPYDDAYFFVRVARNFLEYGAFAWNVEDGPVYGCTSQLFQLLQVGITGGFGGYVVLATRVVLGACLVVAYGLIHACTRRADGEVPAALAFSSPVALFTLASGMETALVLALVAACAWLASAPAAQRLHWSALPLAVVASWLARPDAVVLTAPLLLLDRDRGLLRRGALIAALVGLFLLGFKAYYGTALPLPFYAKQASLSPYDPHFLELSAQSKWLHFGLFASTALPLALVALSARDRTNLVLLGGVAGFVLYHLAATVDVMGMHGRFFAPALPLLALAGARGFAAQGERPFPLLFGVAYAFALGALAVVGWLPDASSGRWERVPWTAYAGTAAFALMLFRGRAVAPRWVGLALGLAVAGYGWKRPSLLSDEDYLSIHERHVTVFRGLDTLRACFGPAVDLYHSEVGVPGLRVPNGKVTDLAGLFNPDFLLGRVSFQTMCERDDPEAIFLPHRNYGALNREVMASSCLVGYERMVSNSASPLYVRKDLAARFVACARRER